MTVYGLSAVAAAWFMYGPGVVETVTLNVRDAVPPGATANDPAQVSTWLATFGSAVVAPDDEPGT